MTSVFLVRLVVAVAGVATFGATPFASALPVPDGPRLALDSVNRPVLRELADLKARESERLGKIEDRFDARLTRLERAAAAASEHSRRETNAALRSLESAFGEQLAAAARSERLVLLAIAGGYLWSALLWIELRRTSRALREASVRKRIETDFARAAPPPAAVVRGSPNGDALHAGLAPPV